MKAAKLLLILALRHGPGLADAITTNNGISRGATEANPMARPFAGTPAVYLYTQAIPLAYELLRWKKPQHFVTKIFRPLVYIHSGAATYSTVNNLQILDRLRRSGR